MAGADCRGAQQRDPEMDRMKADIQQLKQLLVISQMSKSQAESAKRSRSPEEQEEERHAARIRTEVRRKPARAREPGVGRAPTRQEEVSKKREETLPPRDEEREALHLEHEREETLRLLGEETLHLHHRKQEVGTSIVFSSPRTRRERELLRNALNSRGRSRRGRSQAGPKVQGPSSDERANANVEFDRVRGEIAATKEEIQRMQAKIDRLTNIAHTFHMSR